MKIALDHHYSPAIAEQLRRRAHDVVAVVERGWEREDDEPLLAICLTERRTLVTNNVSDFAAIARRWAAEGRSHAGLIFTSDASLPHTRATIGKYVELLDALISAQQQPDPFVDRVHWF